MLMRNKKITAFCRAMLCISVVYAVVRCLAGWLVSATFVYCVETARASETAGPTSMKLGTYILWV